MDTLVDFLLNFHGPTPYMLIFGILMLCGLGFPMPEDIVLFAAGVLSYYGLSDVYMMIVVSMVGVLGGDSIIFFLGSKYGRKLTKKRFFSRILTEERLIEVQKRFHEKGTRLIFAARFMPGLRAPIFFSAGTLHVPFRTFLLYDGTAALLSVPAIVGLVYYWGDDLDWIMRTIQRAEYGIILVILAVIAAIAGKWYLNRRKLQRAA